MWWVLNEATVDLALLDGQEQFEDQASYIGCYSLHWRDVKTQAHDKKTPAKMLPSTLCILVCKDVQSAFLL